MLGRRGRGSPPDAVAAVALDAGRSPLWSVIGWLGTLAIFVIMSYYSVLGGWVLAYMNAFALDELRNLTGVQVGAVFARFLAHPWELLLAMEVIEHRTSKIRSPRTNGFVERMNRTLLDECFRVQG